MSSNRRRREQRVLLLARDLAERLLVLAHGSEVEPLEPGEKAIALRGWVIVSQQHVDELMDACCPSAWRIGRWNDAVGDRRDELELGSAERARHPWARRVPDRRCPGEVVSLQQGGEGRRRDDAAE